MKEQEGLVGGCVCPPRLSYCGDGFCSVRTGMAAFLGHAARHLQFPAVTLGLQFKSAGTYLLNNTYVKGVADR